MDLVDPIVLRRNIVVTRDSDFIPHNDKIYISAEAIERGFEATPTINAEPIKIAKWVEAAGSRTICKHCGEYPMRDHAGIPHKTRFCPHCGSKMLNAEEREVDYA